jgi:hypothetical protein
MRLSTCRSSSGVNSVSPTCSASTLRATTPVDEKTTAARSLTFIVTFAPNMYVFLAGDLKGFGAACGFEFGQALLRYGGADLLVRRCGH